MNILSIWPSHDGCATYIKNNKVVWHTQLDRYNRFKHYPSPSKALIQEFEKIEIDLIILAHNANSKRNEWFELLHESKKLRNIKLYEYGNQHHHLFHAYCGLTWNQKIRPILVCDGNGTYYEKGIENESLYSFGNHVKTESNKIGARYEAFTFKYFGHGLDCGKTMAWSLHDERPKKLQNDFENDMDNLIEKWEITDAIHFTGGCAQNVLYNSKLLNKFDKVFCDPFNGDFGLSLGAANYYLENKIINNEIYLGIPQDIDASIFSKYNIIDTTPDEVAEILLKEPVAIFQSRSEQGQRGLGNRSLLMSPLYKDSHDRLNKIKKREWFRPFACSVLKEKAKEWFEMPIEESPHMMYVFKIKKENALTAGLSINNDSRIQTVSEKDNSHFYNLIKAFDKLVNVPILINTSLNLPGEVLVETMQDLKELFESSELNYIYLPEIGKIIKK